jgi:hypothetical protein
MPDGGFSLFDGLYVVNYGRDGCLGLNIHIFNSKQVGTRIFFMGEVLSNLLDKAS